MIDKTVAILQITLMWLLAFLLGFGVSWIMSGKMLRALREQLHKVKAEVSAYNDQKRTWDAENAQLRRHVASLQEESHRMESQWKNQSQLAEELRRSLAEAIEKDKQQERRYENLKKENDEIRQAASPKSRHDGPTSSEVGSKESRFTPSTWQTRDDLTLIHGIGPVIQKRLQELGIYTFLQISQFTDSDITRVARAIRFFPGRIRRDNWTRQASVLSSKKAQESL